MTKVRVLGPVHIHCERTDSGGDLQPLETSLVLALALTTDDSRGRRSDGTLRLGGLTDEELARAVWNNGRLTRNVQKAIHHIITTTSITIEKRDRRRYLDWPTEELDYNVFSRIQSESRGYDDTRKKFEALGRAVELIEGVPLDGLDTQLSEWLRRKRSEISAEVCDTTAQWLEAAILLNEKWAVLEKACKMQKWFPSDERICQYVMYLLYRANHRSRALECLDTTLAARKGALSQPVSELSRIIKAHGDIVRATESLNLRIPSSGEHFRHRFSFAETGEFLARMLNQGTSERQVIATATPNSSRPIKEWRPDLIAGINRGGSIVGGMLAMHFGLCRVMPIIVLWRTDEHGHREYYVAVHPAREADHPEDNPDTVRHVLLADDAFRSGHHVKLARRALELVFPSTDIRVATMISVRQDVSYGEGPGRGDVGGPTYYGQLVSSRNFQLPWSPGGAHV